MLTEQIVKAQQMAAGLLRALKPADQQRLLLEEGADPARPDPSRTVQALVLAECKVLLSDAELQRAMDAQWGVVPPYSVADAVCIVLKSLLQFVLITFYPPYVDVLAARQKEASRAIYDSVISENPVPEKVEGHMVNFMVGPPGGGKRWVSSSFAGSDNEGTWKQAEDIFLAQRSAMAEAMVTRDRRNYALLQPQAKFIISSVALLLLAVFLTVMPADAATWMIVSLLLWALQLVVLEAYELYSNPVLWWADALNR